MTHLTLNFSQMNMSRSELLRLRPLRQRHFHAARYCLTVQSRSHYRYCWRIQERTVCFHVYVFVFNGSNHRRSTLRRMKTVLHILFLWDSGASPWGPVTTPKICRQDRRHTGDGGVRASIPRVVFYGTPFRSLLSAGRGAIGRLKVDLESNGIFVF